MSTVDHHRQPKNKTAHTLTHTSEFRVKYTQNKNQISVKFRQETTKRKQIDQRMTKKEEERKKITHAEWNQFRYQWYSIHRPCNKNSFRFNTFKILNYSAFVFFFFFFFVVVVRSVVGFFFFISLVIRHPQYLFADL